MLAYPAVDRARCVLGGHGPAGQRGGEQAGPVCRPATIVGLHHTREWMLGRARSHVAWLRLGRRTALHQPDFRPVDPPLIVARLRIERDGLLEVGCLHQQVIRVEGGNGEVQLGKLAVQKGNSDDVRHFGQHMVDDHTKMGDQLRPIAQKIGVDPTSGTSLGEKATESELKLLSGDSFDKAYIKAMVKNHRDDLQAFQKEAANGSDPDVKRAARKGAITVQSHLSMIEQIAKAHNIDVSK